jgi:hypothetical protein
VERFGLPLGRDKTIDELQTDHDVMFLPMDILVSEHEGCSLLIATDKDQLEYVNIVVQNQGCHFLGNISGEQDRLDNMEAKKLLDSVVTNVSMKEFQTEYPELKLQTLLGLSCLMVTQRLLRWNRIQTVIRGPAVNFKVNLNPSLFSKDEWVR